MHVKPAVQRLGKLVCPPLAGLDPGGLLKQCCSFADMVSCRGMCRVFDGQAQGSVFLSFFCGSGSGINADIPILQHHDNGLF